MLKEKQTKMIDALKRNACNISISCKAVGISRQTHYEWLDKSDTYKKEVDDVVEALIDFAESALMRNIKNGNIVSIIFFLKTRGKERGYSQHLTIVHDKLPSGFDLEEI